MAKHADEFEFTVGLDVVPGVKMMEFTGVPYVCAMGVVGALRQLGLGERVGIGWPSGIVCCLGELPRPFEPVPEGEEPPAPEPCAFTDDLGVVEVHAHAGEQGMAASVTVGLDTSVLARVAQLCAAELCPMPVLASTVVNGITATVEAWAGLLRARQAAGPLAPVLSQYFDMVPLLGHPAVALDRHGLPVASGIFTALDIWGKATIKGADGEREFLSEVVDIRPLQ